MENTSLTTREPEVVTTTRRESERVVTPRADILETPEAVVVMLDVPGVDEKDVDITLEKDVLEVSARVVAPERDGFELAWSEYNPTLFRRQFTVSDRVDSDGVSAQLRHGVLRIELKKSERARARKIQVNS
jgi:HSP20 family molecular chaperone IbpA